jgi:hypothetical protein
MLRVVWVALFALFVVGFGSEVWQASQHNREQLSASNVKNSQKSYNGTATTNPNDKKDSKDSIWYDLFKERPTDWLLVLFNFFLVAFTGLLWWSTKKLWEAGERQITIAKETSDRQAVEIAKQLDISRQASLAARQSADAALRAEQAHVYPIVECENVVELVQLESDNPQHIKVRYRLKNFGNTPAIILEARHELIHSAAPPHGDSGKFSPFEVVEVLGSGNDNISHPTDCIGVLYPEEARSVLEGKSTIWFHGFVNYQDVFGYTRHLEYWWWYHGKLPRFGWYRFDPDAP